MNQNIKNTSWTDRIRSKDQERKTDSTEVSQSLPLNNSFESSMDSQFSYAHSNKSSISFESIQTTERLLDKLDLSLEDELILQEALLEEENALRNSQLSQANGPTLCMPASEFPSLRYRSNPSPTYIQARDRSLIIDSLKEKDSSLRGKFSSCKVERHMPKKSRYSYIVEEDYDSETFNISNPQIKRNERDYKYPNYDSNTRGTNTPNSFNFENYRIENTRLHHLYPMLLSSDNDNKNIKKINSNNINNSMKNDWKFEKQGSPNEFVPAQRSTCLHRNGSSTSTNTSFSEVGQLSKPKTQSSFESESSSFAKLKSTKSDTTPVKSSPKRSSSSTSTLTKPNTMTSDISVPPTPPYKTHKKKSSLSSLKKLFKSPRARAKNKKDLESEGSSPIHSATNLLDFSGENTQVQPISNTVNNYSPHLAKYIFPPNPTFHFRTLSSPQSATEKKTNSKVRPNRTHLRTFSDFHTMEKDLRTEELSALTGQSNKPNCPKVIRRTLSLDSMVPNDQAHYTDTLNHRKQESNTTKKSGKLKFHQEPYDNDESLHIGQAITMRHQGKLEESAQRLKRACARGNKTAFLLYGLALRHGCGVDKNLKLSLGYLMAATDIKSFAAEVLDLDINPLNFISIDDIPDIAPEPTAPALYECGMAYLKGLGTDHPDEIKGLKFLEKAALLGHVDSMCLSGTIWSKTSNIKKKDLARAAAWFRIADKKGANLLGSDWIYKEKYMKRGPK
ncbi:hypothetical protein SMKI_02G1180 [Saccharomyces mikatae IFO 1815]|uniref:Dsf2p n=1 Tax=Saccharomyces mikatae IFO 1815 TaxID=226126 RepID=A0AA35IW50_SACMI|nr:uncharacterized protein SMKI_02G1180 [Saccharomyces mikatae IFO 1815]CAI4037250.1 hypothetical protein SMKI_02G1180 [Saccharomyces mikatae IFO 1815]